MMRTRTFLVTVLSSLLVVASVAASQQAPPDKPAPKPIDVNGKWNMTLEMSTGTGNPTLVLKQSGETVTGTYAGRYGEFPLKGTLKGNKIEFGFKMSAEGTDVDLSFAGEVAPDGQSMKGQAEIAMLGDAVWSAVKAK